MGAFWKGAEAVALLGAVGAVVIWSLYRAQARHRKALPGGAGELAPQQPERIAIELAEQATQAGLDGRVEEARQAFAKATEGTTNFRVLYLAYKFYYRTGDLTTAEQVLDRWLGISGRDAESAETASAYGNLGRIYRTRG